MSQNLNDEAPQKALLTFAEFCTYLGIKKTKGREILADPACPFRFRIGNRLYVNKKKLDSWLAQHDELP